MRERRFLGAAFWFFAGNKHHVPTFMHQERSSPWQCLGVGFLESKGINSITSYSFSWAYDTKFVLETENK